MVDLGKFAKPGKVPPLAVLTLVARRVGGVSSRDRLLDTTATGVDGALDAGRGIAGWLLADPQLSAIPLEEQSAIFGKPVEQVRALHAAAGRSAEACQARDALKAQLLQAQEATLAEEGAAEGAPTATPRRTSPQSGRPARQAKRRSVMPQPDDATAAEAETLTIATFRGEPKLILERDEGVSRDAALQAVVRGCSVTAKALRAKERGGWDESGARFVLMLVLHYICGDDYDVIAGFLGGRAAGAIDHAIREFTHKLEKDIQARRRLQAALHQLYPRKYAAPEGVVQTAAGAGQDEEAVNPSRRGAVKPATAKDQDGAKRARRAGQAVPEGARASASTAMPATPLAGALAVPGFVSVLARGAQVGGQERLVALTPAGQQELTSFFVGAAEGAVREGVEILQQAGPVDLEKLARARRGVLAMHVMLEGAVQVSGNGGDGGQPTRRPRK